MSPQDEAPKGYRLLLQCFDARSEEEACIEVARVFRGRYKLDDLIVGEGSYKCKRQSEDNEWVKQDGGYMVFVKE